MSNPVQNRANNAIPKSIHRLLFDNKRKNNSTLNADNQQELTPERITQYEPNRKITDKKRKNGKGNSKRVRKVSAVPSAH